MQVKVLNETGHDEALLGLSLSFYDHKEPLEEFWNDEKKQRAYKRASSLAYKGGGHNKFLESIQVWIFVQASRAWWSEADTYRAGITKQSASTMHTLSKRVTTLDDYESGTTLDSVIAFNRLLRTKPDITTLKMNLPEGWLQERIICTNYKCLQNMLAQRHNHRLKQWPEFCDSLLTQLKYPEWIDARNTSKSAAV